MSNIELHNGDLLDVLVTFEPNSIDTCICDPPYHLESITKRFGKKNSAPAKEADDGSFSRVSRGFMGKVWDGGKISFDPETWKKVYRVLKPGAYLLAFGSPRTYHRMTISIEDAGFEIRDCIMWLYGSGFPKSADLAKMMRKRDVEDADKWDGFKMSLKPAYEPIVVAMKPLSGTRINNALKYGVSGLNTEAARIPLENEEGFVINTWDDGAKPFGGAQGESYTGRIETKGRYPSNVIIDENASEMLDEYSRFFYTAKANKVERNLGLDGNSTHPTVKPIELMRYLCRLTSTPTGGIVVDPFMGSGSTGIACILEGRDFVGVEQDDEYFKIAQKRIGHFINDK